MSETTQDRSRLRAAVNRRLLDIARRRRELIRLQAEMNARLDAVRKEHSDLLNACRQHLGALENRFAHFCRKNRRALVPDGRKSLRTDAGLTGFRTAPPSVRIRRGVSQDEVCRRLRARGLSALVRVRETPDRCAIHEAVQAGRVEASLLSRCGVSIANPQESFYFRLDPELSLSSSETP